jgi:hypothetical protein
VYVKQVLVGTPAAPQARTIRGRCHTGCSGEELRRAIARTRSIIRTEPFLLVRGRLQKREGTLKVQPLENRRIAGGAAGAQLPLVCASNQGDQPLWEGTVAELDLRSVQ